MKNDNVYSTKFKLTVYARTFAMPIVLGALIFIPAGTIDYWEAWVYITVLFFPMIIFNSYMLIKDPELLNRRMKVKEKEKVQKWVVTLISIVFLSLYITAGLDKRYGWSESSIFVIILSDITILLSYLFFMKILLENRYASHTVEVEEDHKLITTGPYKIIRHPMYIAIIIMFISTPLALGSYWAALGNIFIIPAIAARIINEEKVLVESLNGYPEYMKNVKYRLIPRVW